MSRSRTAQELKSSLDNGLPEDSFVHFLRPDDRHRIKVPKNLKDIQRQPSEAQTKTVPTAAPQDLLALDHVLDKRQHFLEIVASQADPPIDCGILIGGIDLIVQLSLTEGDIAPAVLLILQTTLQKIEHILNQYDTDTGSLQDITSFLFQIARSLHSSIFAIIVFYRQYRYNLSLDRKAHDTLEQHFNALNAEIDNVISHLAMTSEVAGDDGPSQRQLKLLASTSWPVHQDSYFLPETADLPCLIYPTSRPLHFFDHTESTTDMDMYFKNKTHGPDQPFRSLALYGVGGVGKSSVALRYAETRISRKELDAMFWIAGEKEVTMRQSFTDIAMQLELPEAHPKDHDRNKSLVLKWLQSTKRRWLLVFDNIETVDLLISHWPISSRGQVVVTTRNPRFAFYPCDGGLEVHEWDNSTSFQYLGHLLSTENAHYMEELSLRFSGYALVLSLMAGLIQIRNCSVEEFVKRYDSQQKILHKSLGNGSINTLWIMSFRSLDEGAHSILGVLAFLSPDHIPKSIFEPKKAVILPQSLKFCQETSTFRREIEVFTALALVKHNEEESAFSVHKLVQSVFQKYIGVEGRQKSFDDASVLLSAAFPRQDAEFSQMYHSWKLCSLYLPHVLRLRDFFRNEKKRNLKFSAPMEYCSLNNACQRYLVETNNYKELLDLTDVNAIALSAIPPQSKSIQFVLEGTLASHRGQALERVGRAEEAVIQLKFAYETFAKDEPRNLREEAWCAENLADAFATANNFHDTILWQEKARDHWLQWSRDGSWPTILKWGTGTNLVGAGQNTRSKEVLEDGLAQLEATEPYNWAMAAYTSFSLGTVARADGEHEAAERYFTEAYSKWTSGDNILSDPFCGGYLYRIGCAALDQQKLSSAIKCLREAAVVTERHKTHMPVEHARTLFKFSKALAEHPGGQAEAEKLFEESEQLLSSRCQTAIEPTEEKQFNDLVFIWWR